MSEAVDNWQCVKYVPLTVVQQQVHLPDDEFEARYFDKFYRERDFLWNNCDPSMISSSSRSNPVSECKADQVTIDQIDD